MTPLAQVDPIARLATAGPRWWEPVHITTLESMAQCPAKFRVACTAPDTDSPVYRIGRAFHSLALGRGDQVVIYQGRRDERQAAWRDFRSDNAGRIILSESEAEVAVPLAQAVRDNENARALIDRCTHIEEPLEGRLLDFPVHATPDAWDDFGLVLDLKSARFGEPESFQRSGARRGYLAQIDWYATLLEQLTGRPYPDRYVISADKSCPIPECVTVHRVTPAASEQGRKCWRAWLEELRTCVDSDCFPGYALGVVDWDADPELAEPADDGEAWEPEGDAA